MLRRNRKKDEALASDEPRGAHHIPSQPSSSSLIFRTNTPPITHDQPALPLPLPNSFAPHAKTSTSGSSNSGNGQTSNSTTNTTYPQASPSAQLPSSSSSMIPAAGVPRSPRFQDRQLPAHILHPSAAQNQYPRGAAADREKAMMPPAKRSLMGTRHLQNVYSDSPYSQSVDALGSDGLHSVQSNELQSHAPAPSPVQQPSNVGRSQSAFNFLLAKARASFSSSSSSNASTGTSAAAASTAAPPTFQSHLIPSASLSAMHASGSVPFYEEQGMMGGRADGVIGRNRVASESSGSLLQNSGTRSGQRARPSFGEESAPASSPTKRGFFSRERKASLVSLGKSGNAARQAFSNSPLGRAPQVRYGSPTDRTQGGSPLISQFSKSQSDLHSRREFPSPPSTNLDLPNFLSPSQSVSVMQSAAHRAAANSGDSALLRSPSPNVGFSRSVDDLNHERGSPPVVSSDFLFNSPADRDGPWAGEQGLAPTDRGRASDTGALGLGRSRGSSVTLDASPSIGQVSMNGNPRNAWEHENQTYDSPRHQRKSSRPKINVRAADSSTVTALVSPREHPKPALGPGVTYDALLMRNTNVSMSINQLNGKDKEKEIGKGWKPFRVVLKEGRMYFYKPSSNVADEVKLLFPTSLTPADYAQRRDTSPARLSPKSNTLSTSPSAPGLSMEDIKRGKLSTRDLLAATSSSQDTDSRPNPRRHQKDSRLSAIMDSAEAESSSSPSTQPTSLPEWAHADAHGDLVFSSSATIPPAWVDRIQGGSANALAHEYVYATQSNGSTSSRENGAMLQFIMDHLRETSMPPQVFLSSVRKWAARALLEEGKTGDEFEHDVKARLHSLVDANLPAQMGDEGAKGASQRMVDDIADHFHIPGADTDVPSSFINMRTDQARAQGTLSVPNESQRQLSTSAPSHFNTSPVLPQSAPSEKETRRMTAFFRTAVRPMGLMSSSPSTLASETVPRGYNELLSSVVLQKPAAAVQCGSSRVSIWHNGQRSYVFNLTPPDGGHVLLQAHTAEEMQEWCNAIEQASKTFAKSVMASAEMQRKGSGGIAVPVPLTLKPGKGAPKIALYGTDVKILAEQDGSGGVPLGLARMLEEVEKRGLREQGLYRISGAKSAIEALKGAFMTQPASSVNLSTGELSDVHTIAGAIKQWFRDLPEPAIPFASYHSLIAAERIEGEEDRLYAFRDIIWDIPRAHFELLRRISAHLAMVCNEGKYNLMAPHNIGLVFGTSLLNPPPGPASVAESFGNIGKAAHIVKIIVTTHEWLFEPEPEPEADLAMKGAGSQEDAAAEQIAEQEGPALDPIPAGEGSGAEPEEKAEEVAADEDDIDASKEGVAPASAYEDKSTTAKSVIAEDGEAKDASVEEEEEGEEGEEEEDKGSNTLTLSQSEDTSGSTTLGLEAEPITPADGSEAGMDRVQDDSTPRQSLADSEGGPVPWLENPLLTVDEGTIDSHASDSSMMRAVMGAHPISPVKADDRMVTKPTLLPQLSLNLDDKGKETESGFGGTSTASKSFSAAPSNSDLRPSLSRANSSQQVFSDVEEELPSGADQQQERQKRFLITTEPHDRTVESVYLDATDAMAILQNNYEDGQQEGRRSTEEVEEVLEQQSTVKRRPGMSSSSSSSEEALEV